MKFNLTKITPKNYLHRKRKKKKKHMSMRMNMPATVTMTAITKAKNAKFPIRILANLLE